jgi:hypothetical protein
LDVLNVENQHRTSVFNLDVDFLSPTAHTNALVDEQTFNNSSLFNIPPDMQFTTTTFEDEIQTTTSMGNESHSQF